MDSHLANIINHDLDNNSFSKGAKITTVRLICKKNDKDKIDNYRPSNESKRISNQICSWQILISGVPQ